jgi:hypothetical protein
MTLIGKSYFEANSMRGMELSASKRFASSIRSYTTYSCGARPVLLRNKFAKCCGLIWTRLARSLESSRVRRCW